MLLDLEEKTRVLVEDIVERSAIGRGAIFVLGLSSSEVAGGTIGKASSREIGQRIVKTILEVLEPKGISLAVQGCEHLNRALVVERELAMAKDFGNCECSSDLARWGKWSAGCFRLYEGSC